MAAFAQLKRKLSNLKSRDRTLKAELGTYTYHKTPFGCGSYGKVHKGEDRNSRIIAVKTIAREGRQNPKVEHLVDDLGKLVTLEHNNIVQMMDWKVKPEQFYLVMEFCPLGDLNTFLRPRAFNIYQVIEIIKQASQGLMYLHENGVVHRDIKPDNMLVAAAEPLVIKLADFDLSKIFPPDFTTSTMSSEVGSPLFKAPEHIMLKKYNRPADVFSLAISSIAILQNDWSEEGKLIPRVENRKLPSDRYYPPGSVIADRMTNKEDDLQIITDDESSPNPLKQLMQDMTQAGPKKRPKLPEVLQRLEELPKEGLQYDRVEETMVPNTRVIYPQALQMFPAEGKAPIVVKSVE